MADGAVATGCIPLLAKRLEVGEERDSLIDFVEVVY